MTLLSIKKIHPVILTPQALPCGLAFNAKGMDEVRAQNFLTDVEPLGRMTAEEAELILRLYAKGGTSSDLLTRKASHSHPKARGDSIKNYLFYFEGNTLDSLKLTEESDGDKRIADILDLIKTSMGREATAPT